jgi:hypothetical protein
LPQGGYHLVISGYNAADDAHIHAQLLLRNGTSDSVIAEADGPPPAPGTGKRTWIDTTLCAPAQTGDALRLHIQLVSGSMYFASIITDLDIP